MNAGRPPPRPETAVEVGTLPVNAGPATSKTAFHLVGRLAALSAPFGKVALRLTPYAPGRVERANWPPHTEDGLIPGQDGASIEIVDPRSSKNPGGSTTKACSLISEFHRGKALPCVA